VHPDVQVVPLGIGCSDVLGIGIAFDTVLDALSGAAPYSLISIA
jgi:hypothetical protein